MKVKDIIPIIEDGIVIWICVIKAEDGLCQEKF